MLKFYDVSGIKIACWTQKEHFDPRKKIFFIHGAGGNHSLWSYQYGRLRKNFNVAAIDLPGHAQSGGSGEKDVGRYRDWIRKILTVFGWKKTVLVGHSLGAAIALCCAGEDSEGLAGIVCIGAGLKMPVNSFFLDYLKTNPPVIPAEVTELICKFSLARENRTKLFAPLQMSIAQSGPEVMYGDLLACQALDLTPVVGKISVPALIVCGAEDKMTPPDMSRALAKALGRARLEIIEGAGHMVMLEQPDSFNALLDEFASTF